MESMMECCTRYKSLFGDLLSDNGHGCLTVSGFVFMITLYKSWTLDYKRTSSGFVLLCPRMRKRKRAGNLWAW
eukprot:767251-Hanusia_phi.AAC.2